MYLRRPGILRFSCRDEGNILEINVTVPFNEKDKFIYVYFPVEPFLNVTELKATFYNYTYNVLYSNLETYSMFEFPSELYSMIFTGEKLSVDGAKAIFYDYSNNLFFEIPLK